MRVPAETRCVPTHIVYNCVRTHTSADYHPLMPEKTEKTEKTEKAAKTGPVEIEAWRALLQVQNGAMRGIEADLKAHHAVPLSWYDVLLELVSADGHRLRMAELADRVVLSRTRVSRLVDELVREGLADRQPDPDDGRASFAVLTKAGAQAQRQAAPIYLRGIHEHFGRHLSASECRTGAKALGKVAQATAS